MEITHLFDNNRQWAARMVADDPQFFQRLSAKQSPEFLWIGCADSRVPANEIVGLLPGELFVHRNVANVVVQTDLNCLSVLQYAVEVLEVRHVIVCGHYGCGGVRAALERRRHGFIYNWLRHVQCVADTHEAMLRAIPDVETRADRLCELNVIEQARQVCLTTVVQEAWRRGQELSVHGWVYGLSDGHIHDLQASCGGADLMEEAFRRAVHTVAGAPATT